MPAEETPWRLDHARDDVAVQERLLDEKLAKLREERDLSEEVRRILEVEKSIAAEKQIKTFNEKQQLDERGRLLEAKGRILQVKRSILAEEEQRVEEWLAEERKLLAEERNLLAEERKLLAEDSGILSEDWRILAEDWKILAILLEKRQLVEDRKISLEKRQLAEDRKISLEKRQPAEEEIKILKKTLKTLEQWLEVQRTVVDELERSKEDAVKGARKCAVIAGNLVDSSMEELTRVINARGGEVSESARLNVQKLTRLQPRIHEALQEFIRDVLEVSTRGSGDGSSPLPEGRPAKHSRRTTGESHISSEPEGRPAKHPRRTTGEFHIPSEPAMPPETSMTTPTTPGNDTDRSDLKSESVL